MAGLGLLAYGWIAGFISPLVIIVLILGPPDGVAAVPQPGARRLPHLGCPRARGLRWASHGSASSRYLAFFFLQTEQMLAPFLR